MNRNEKYCMESVFLYELFFGGPNRKQFLMLTKLFDVPLDRGRELYRELRDSRANELKTLKDVNRDDRIEDYLSVMGDIPQKDKLVDLKKKMIHSVYGMQEYYRADSEEMFEKSLERGDVVAYYADGLNRILNQDHDALNQIRKAAEWNYEKALYLLRKFGTQEDKAHFSNVELRNIKTELLRDGVIDKNRINERYLSVFQNKNLSTTWMTGRVMFDKDKVYRVSKFVYPDQMKKLDCTKIESGIFIDKELVGEIYKGLQENHGEENGSIVVLNGKESFMLSRYQVYLRDWLKKDGVTLVTLRSCSSSDFVEDENNVFIRDAKPDVANVLIVDCKGASMDQLQEMDNYLSLRRRKTQVRDCNVMLSFVNQYVVLICSEEEAELFPAFTQITIPPLCEEGKKAMYQAFLNECGMDEKSQAEMMEKVDFSENTDSLMRRLLFSHKAESSEKVLFGFGGLYQ